MTTTVDIKTLVVSTPGTCSRHPRIAKSRITVKILLLILMLG
ncbi:hypothetical protein [Microcoleus sp. Pol12A6]